MTSTSLLPRVSVILGRTCVTSSKPVLFLGLIPSSSREDSCEAESEDAGLGMFGKLCTHAQHCPHLRAVTSCFGTRAPELIPSMGSCESEGSCSSGVNIFKGQSGDQSHTWSPALSKP